MVVAVPGRVVVLVAGVSWVQLARRLSAIAVIARGCRVGGMGVPVVSVVGGPPAWRSVVSGAWPSRRGECRAARVPARWAGGWRWPNERGAGESWVGGCVR